jgi:hypothetical protein
MKRLLASILLVCLSGSSFANTIFECETARGKAVLERVHGRLVFDLQMSTCMLEAEKLEPIVNRGLGYDSWELPLANNSQLCSYAIEFVDDGTMQQYSVVQYTNGQRTESICEKDSVEDHVFDNPQ